MSAVLLIEDDQRVCESLTRALSARGYAVDCVRKGLEGLDRLIGQDCDLVLLDLGLPDVDGAELLLMIRSVSDVPVIVVTARDEQSDVVETLEAGADDYLVKPFSTGELDARIKAVLRRLEDQKALGPLKVAGLVVDPAARAAWLDDRPLELSRKEFDLLAYLVARPGVVIPKPELLAQIWRQPYGGSDKTIDVHLSWLRGKLGETAAEPRYLHTVRGVGIKLVDPED